MDEDDMSFRIVHLEPLLAKARALWPDLGSVYLFGSRRYATGSKRSDIDLLFEFDDSASAPDQGFYLAMRKLEPYLDCFLLDRGVARSLVNGSEIRCASDESLRSKVGASQIFDGTTWVGIDEFKSHTVLAKANPAMTLSWQFPGIEDPARERFDVLLMTAMHEEYVALKAVFEPIEEDSEATSVALLSSKSGVDVNVRLATAGAMGPVQAGIAALKWLSVSKAPIVILTGIAAGLKGKHTLGEVVVPSAVYDYELAKVETIGSQARPAFFNVDKSWHVSSQALATNWRPSQTVVDLSPTGALPSLNASCEAVLASGSKVVANRRAAKRVLSAHGKASAIEMESAGVGAAAEALGADRSFLVVKAISDFADRKKGDDWHSYCSHASAEFARSLIVDRF